MATVPKVAKKKAADEAESNNKCEVMAKDNDIILGILDTYHDFCKGERVTQSARKKKAEQEEKSEKGSVGSDDDEEGDPKRVEIMRDYLPQLVQSLYGAKKVGKSYQENIKILTCNEVTSVSSIEHSAVDMFESKQPFRDILNAKPESKEVLTFDQIISAYTAASDKNNIPLWKKYREGLHNSILELSKSGRRYGKGSASEADEKKELAILSSFILNYFFFTDAPPGGVYMTFDAGERIVGDIFHDRENVKCVIFPETLADSATTSLGMLSGRNEFLYPSESKIIEFTSNLFTRNKYKIYFENKGFGDQNPYGFTLVIESVANPDLKLTMPFSPKQTEGPSVNYLIDILDNAQKEGSDKIPYANIKKKGTILNLGAALDANKEFRDQFEKEIKAHTNGILPDLKRGGDHEAVLISKEAETFQGGKYKNFVFCTIDILCALKSRLEQINTIWQGKDKIIMYRYPTTIPTEVVKVKLIEKGKEIYDLLTKLKTFLTVKLTDDLNAQLANFEMGKKADVDYSDREKVTPYKERCEEALNALLRIVMLDLTEYIQSFKDEVSFTGLDKDALAKISALTLFYSEFYSESLDTLKTRVDESGIYNGHDINAEFKEVLSFYTTVTENIKNYIHLEINAGQENEKIEESDKTLSRTYQIQKPVISQKPNSTDPKKSDDIFLLQEHPVFGFNPSVFEKFYDALMYIHEITKKNIERPARDYSKTMNKILSGDITAPYDYFELIDDLVNQFQTKEYRSAVRDIVDFRREPTGAAKTKNQLEEDRIRYVVGMEAMTKKDGGEGDDDYTHLENGVINNLRNYYNTLLEGTKLTAGLTTLTYVPPVPPTPEVATVAVDAQKKGRRKGGAQSGGEITSIFQYYDLNDLLYKISSMAASFIESAYSQEFPQYAVYNKFRRLETYFEKEKGRISSKQSNEIQLHLKNLLQEFTTLYKDPDIFPSIEAYSTKAQRYTAWDAQVNVIQTELSTTNFEKAFDEFNNGLKLFLKTDVAGEILVPTIEEFLQLVSSDAYSVPMEDEWTVSSDGVVVPPKTEQLDTLLYEDICMTWQAGLYEIRQNKEYYYRYSEVDDLVSYFVSLRNRTILESIEASSNNNENNENSNFEENEENEGTAEVGETAPTSSNVIITSTLGTELQFIDSTTGIAHTSTPSSLLRRIHELNEVIGTAKTKNISIATSVLFMLTLIENIMNKTKHSFFIKETYKRSQFQSRTLWDTNVYALLTQLSASMNVSFSQTKLSLGLASYGGSRSYPKKTRKYAARKGSRKSKKYNKTRRVR